jgi:hypothetical protein
MTNFISTQPLFKWWGPQELAHKENLKLQMGPLALSLDIQAADWNLTWNRESISGQARFIFGHTQSQLIVVPSLPDRNVTTKFNVPLRILPGDSVKIYIVVPLWVVLRDQNHTKLLELPTWRLSDTWIGQSSIEGELGYAGRVPANTEVSAVPHRLDLAVSPVWIRNQSSSVFIINHFNLPAPHLTLYYSEEAGFWTDTLTVEQTGQTELVNVKFEAHAPSEAKQAQIMSHPREQALEAHRVIRAFSALFKQ